MKRLVLLAAAVAVAASVSPASAAAGCPDGWYSRPTGYTNPVTGRPITHCWPMS